MESLISQIKVNKDRLSAEHLGRVTEIHRVNVEAFNKNILGAYNYKDRLYYEECAGIQGIVHVAAGSTKT